MCRLKGKVLIIINWTTGHFNWIEWKSLLRGHERVGWDNDLEWRLSFVYLSTSTSGLIVYLGRQSQEGSNPNEVSQTVTQIINHPDYNSDTNDNDICLLKLSSPVTFTKYILPVCLAAPDSTFHDGTDSWVTGWGNVRFQGGSERVPFFFFFLTLGIIQTFL